MKYFLLISVCLITICACQQRTKNAEATIKVDTVEYKNNVVQSGYHDTVRINYAANKVILDVLPLLPDSLFKTWAWKVDEREQMLTMLKQHNWFIDTTKDYNTIKKVTPNFFKTIVVDGTFSVACYKVTNTDHVFITMNQVGDGKDLVAFEYTDGRLSQLNIDFLLGEIDHHFLIDPNNDNCKEMLDDARAFLDYDFEKKDVIEISAPIKKKGAEACFNGNTLKLRFNPASKKFDLEKTIWEHVETGLDADSTETK